MASHGYSCTTYSMLWQRMPPNAEMSAIEQTSLDPAAAAACVVADASAASFAGPTDTTWPTW
jgi:hypothetical protein